MEGLQSLNVSNFVRSRCGVCGRGGSRCVVRFYSVMSSPLAGGSVCHLPVPSKFSGGGLMGLRRTFCDCISTKRPLYFFLKDDASGASAGAML